MSHRDVAAEKGWPWLNMADQPPFTSGFRPVIAENGMVSSPHALASQVGLHVLRSGGNAVDAAVATSAALMVVVPMQCSPGGDAFWAIGAPGRSPVVLNASGRSPRRASREALSARGLNHIPSRSVWAVTVPGAVRGWRDALRRFGTRPLAELLAPAIELASSGVFVSRHFRASIDVATPILRRSRLGRTTFLDGGATPPLYARIRQPQLAETLWELGRTDGESLYSGRLAADLIATVREHGGWLDEDDLSEHESSWQAPLELSAGAFQLYAPPPNSQGAVLLGALALDAAASGLGVADPDHRLIESMRLARAEWEALRGPLPDQEAAARGLLEVISARASEIHPDRARAQWTAPAAHGSTGRHTDGDTANLVVVDRDRMVVSCTQSIFDDFGSGVAVDAGGYMLQSRGSTFSLEEGAPNELSGATLPPHSLCPVVRYRDGQPDVVLGAMGGAGQPQSLAQVLARLDTSDPAEAIAAPRWYVDFAQRDDSVVLAESRTDPAVLEELGRRGHRVVGVGPWEDVMGHVQLISVESSGALVGAADPRSDGQAVGW